jgi:hypothetical protein
VWFQTTISLTDRITPRSICHHGVVSMAVWLNDWRAVVPSGAPSGASRLSTAR